MTERYAGWVQLTGTPRKVNQWLMEDQAEAELDTRMRIMTTDEARQALEDNIVRVPENIVWKNMRDYAQTQQTPLKLELPPELNKYDYYLAQVPVNVLIGSNYRIVRLRLSLEFSAVRGSSKLITAYDYFPTRQVDTRTIMSGSASVDVSKALKFIPSVGTQLADALGLKLEIPFKWNSTSVKIKEVGKMSNPLVWDVYDTAISESFIGYVIIQAPKQTNVEIKPQIVWDLRKVIVPGVLSKSQPMGADGPAYILKNM